MAKLFIILGVLLILIGLLFPILQKIGLGRLPGDIFLKGKNFSFYFPIVTSIIVSIVVSIVISIVFWFFKK